MYSLLTDIRSIDIFQINQGIPKMFYIQIVPVFTLCNNEG